MAKLVISARQSASAVNFSTLEVDGKPVADWVIPLTLSSTVRKSGGSLLSGWTHIGGPGTDPFSGGGSAGTALNWTDDGDSPTSGSASGNDVGVRQNSFNATDSRGHSFTCSIGVEERTIRVYCGHYADDTGADRFSLTATISDGSTSPQTVKWAGTTSDTDSYFDIQVAAASAGQTVTVEYYAEPTGSTLLRAINLRGYWVSTEGDAPPPTPYPTVVARDSDRTTTTNTTSHAIAALGRTSHQAGDLIHVHLAIDGNPNVTAPVGWTKLGQESNSNVVTGAVFWKIAESSSESLTLTSSVSEQSSHTVQIVRPSEGYQIAGISGSPANGSSTNSNPPNHSPGVGEQNFLSIATRAGDSTVVATAAPSGYSNLQTLAAAGTGGASTNTAERQFIGTSEDPGTFTSANEQWVSWTNLIWQALVENDTNINADSIGEVTASANLTSSIILSGDALSQALATGGLLSNIVLASNANAEAIANAGLTTQINLESVALSVSTALADLTAGADMSIAAESAVLVSATGSLTTQIQLNASAVVEALADAVLSNQISLNAISAAESLATATLSSTITLIANSTGEALATGNLTHQIQLNAEALASVAADGVLTTEIPLAGAAEAEVTAEAVLTSAIVLVGTAISEATATASLDAPNPIAAEAFSISSATGELITQIQFSADALVTALAEAELLTAIPLSGDAELDVTGSADLQTQILLAGDAFVVATAEGTMNQVASLTAHAMAEATAFGVLTSNIRLSADALVSALVAGSLTTEIVLGATSSAIASAVADLSAGKRNYWLAITIQPNSFLFSDIDKSTVLANRLKPLTTYQTGVHRVH